jgi:hypothetical protein
VDAVPTHLGHGDRLGNCTTTTTMAAANVIREEGDGYQMTIYPNPVWENLNIRVNKLEAGALVQVYNTQGAVVLTQRLTNTLQSLSVKALIPGIFYVKVINGNKSITQKIVKQ